MGLLAVCASPVLAGPKPSPYLKSDQKLVFHYAAVEGSKLHRITLPGGPQSFIELKESPAETLKSVDKDGKTVDADGETTCFDAQGSQTANAPAAKCLITVARGAHADPNEARAVIAHEVFHVYQAVMAGTIEHFDQEVSESSWLIEGSAQWVDSVLVNPNRGATYFWKAYLNSPAKSLFERSYDAVGFYGHLASRGINLWDEFPAMFGAASSEDAYLAAGAASKEVLNSEASEFFRKPSFGREWDLSGPNVPSSGEVGFTPHKVKVAAGAKPITLTVAPYADGVYDLSVSAPVIELGVSSGIVRLRSTEGSGVNELEPTRLALCGDPHGCNCPGQPPNHYAKFSHGDLAITGGRSGGSLKIVARKRCEKALPNRSCQGLLPLPRGAVTEQLQPADQPIPGLSLPEPVNNILHPTECTFWGPPAAETGTKQLVAWDWLFVWEGGSNRPPPTGAFADALANASKPPLPITYDYGIGTGAAVASQPETVTESVQWVGEPPEAKMVSEVSPEITVGEVEVRNDEFVLILPGSSGEALTDLTTVAKVLEAR